MRKNVFDLDRAIVFFDDLLDNRKAESGALGLGGDIGFKCTCSDLIWEAAPIVAYAETYRALQYFGADCDGGFCDACQCVLSIL